MRPETYVESQELVEFFQVAQEVLTKYHTFYFGFPPRQLVLSSDELAYFGPEGLDDILTLALKSLDDENFQQGVSGHIRQVQIWRKSRLEAQPQKTKLGEQGSE